MDGIYYEADILSFPLGQKLKRKFKHLPWVEIENHNNIESLRTRPNSDFGALKNLLIIGTRKTHNYTFNEKISDFLVPWTSSGCSAACLYCYLVCNYNKCSYLRIFVNREQMMEKLSKHSHKYPDSIYEIGSNSDLILENQMTENLAWTCREFLTRCDGKITFPTKFHMIDDLLNIEHQNRILPRISVNPENIITQIELKTSPLEKRIEAMNRLCVHDYPCHILIAPIIFTQSWEEDYLYLLNTLQKKLSKKAQESVLFELIFMTYSYVHHQINTAAFPMIPPLYDKNLMKSRGYGKYGYNDDLKAYAKNFFMYEIEKRFGKNRILYIV